jgi:hypothetical protein
MRLVKTADGPQLLTDCLDTLESLSVTSRALKPSKSFICSRASSELTEDLTACTDRFVRTTELLKARAESISDEALLDLKDRLRSVPYARSKSSRDGSSNLSLLRDIRQSTQILDSFRRTADLLDNLDKALNDLSGSIDSDTEDYIDSVNEKEDIPLPPPLKVSGTFWPKRRIGTDECLRHREKAKTDASRWQKVVLGEGGSHEIRSLIVRSKYLSCHCLIKISARWQE